SCSFFVGRIGNPSALSGRIANPSYRKEDGTTYETTRTLPGRPTQGSRGGRAGRGPKSPHRYRPSWVPLRATLFRGRPGTRRPAARCPGATGPRIHDGTQRLSPPGTVGDGPPPVLHRRPFAGVSRTAHAVAAPLPGSLHWLTRRAAGG